MPRSFSRYEQFLRIFALLDILSKAHQPLDDQSLISVLRERLGLTRLSPRTLRRDCDFLTACGHAVDHMPLPDGRRFGWRLAKDAVNGRPIPAEPLTLLELVAVNVGRGLLKPFEGTVLWTGIESLCHKLERDAPAGLCERLNFSRELIHVRGFDARYGTRPRLVSTLATAITDCCELEVEMNDGHPGPQRLQPYFILIEPAVISLLAFPVDATASPPAMQTDIRNIQNVKQLDSRFSRRAVTLDEMLS